MDINNVSLTGRITKDLELRSTQSGKSVVSFNLAVNGRKDQNGNQHTDFVQCQAWGKTAEVLSEYCSKGSRIGIEGRINTRNYDNQQGQKVYVTEVIVSNLIFLDTKTSQNNGDFSSNNQSETNYQQSYQQANTQGNFNQNQMISDSMPVDINEDDLPF